MFLEEGLLQGRALEELIEFLEKAGLRYDYGIEYTVCIRNDNGQIMGTGSAEANVMKCVAVEEQYRGQGFLSTIISDLVQYLFEKGRTDLFLYTKPANLEVFADMGFYPVGRTEEILLMENRRNGFEQFLRQLKIETPEAALKPEAKIGAVVANGNPFTMGHRYLLEKGLEQCDFLHLFLLSDNRSEFTFAQRYEMAKWGTEGLDRVILHRTAGYLVSAATFPTYFFKDQRQGERANCRLDIELFGSGIAPELHITERFVGTEPCCRVTASYNAEMKRFLPFYGIRVHEIERIAGEKGQVSASKVRRWIREGEYAQVAENVPEKVYTYLCEICKMK